MTSAPMPRSSYALVGAVLLLALATTGCGGDRDQDRQRRFPWIQEQTKAHKLFGREFLSYASTYEFYDGWYPVEADAKTGFAWRWMEKRGIIRLRTVPSADARSAQDMVMKLVGWVPQEHVGLRKIILEFAVNGHVLGRFDPPQGTFEHPVFVPRWLLEHSDWVDFTITVSNTARPNGDWRDLGFATTGFQWTPVGGS